MHWRRLQRPALAQMLCAMAVLSAACFGGGPPAAQPTPTTAAPAPPSIPSPAVSPSPLASPSPSPTVARPSGPEQSHTVEDGETLAIISEKFYGDPTMWRKIYDANRSAIGDNPDAIKVGTQLRIPPKE